MNSCPQCREPYSIRLPSTKYYSRCGLPLTLQCGHGVCYHCVVSKRSNQKHGTIVTKNDPNATEISCSICHVVSTISHEAVRNVLALINCYQLGLLQLEELGLEVAGENICFKDGSDGLFVPSSPQPTLERQPFITPGKCSTHSFTMEFWCYEDEVPLCKGCRISYHLQHDVVKIIDRNKVEMEVFYSVADETVQLVDEMKKTCKEIKDQTKRVQSEYDVAIKEMRRHFSDLHAILAAREQQVQHQLFGAFQECTSLLKSVEWHLRDASQDISSQLQKAATAVSNHIPPSRSAITRWTESIRHFNIYETVIKETLANINSVTFSTTMEPIPEYADHLLHDSVASVSSASGGRIFWTQLQNQYGDVKQKTNRQLVDNLNSKSPCEKTENKKAKKHPRVISPSIAANHQYEVGTDLTGRVVHIDAERFYVHVQSDSSSQDAVSELNQLQTRIQMCERNPAPGLHDLHTGQMVAGLFEGLWYRALIEDINLKCDDIVIFFVDYGNRDLTSVQSIRTLSDDMMNLPAQAVRCALPKNTAMSELHVLMNETQLIHMQVDRVEQGGVGRLDGQELTLWITLRKPEDCKNDGTINSQENPVDPFVAWPQSRIHKIRTIPTPPPPDAMGTKRKRFPAKDWVPTVVNSAKSQSTMSMKSTVEDVPAPIVLPIALNQIQENSHRVKIITSHLNSTGDFYARVESAQKTYLNLVQQLDSHFSMSSELLEQLKPGDGMTVGQVCAVKLDGQWNRCRVVEIVDNKTASVHLMDVGKRVNSSQLYRLEQPRLMATPVLAFHCRLWGIRPAGHATKWSGSSFDKMKEAIKISSALFVQVYFIQEEEIEDSGIFASVHYVRFYYEYIKPGGPMEFDQTLTSCFNDMLFEHGLALRDPMLVTVQPLPKRWLPSVSLPPELENATPIWLDDEGFIYFHRPRGPTNHVSVINKLLAWHYGKSTPNANDLTHWIKDEPCVVLYTDSKWYRAIVQSCDDENQTASVFFVDYGNSQLNVPYTNLRKSLLCYEYPIQAHRCRLARFPAPGVKPNEEQLSTLHELLIDRRITVTVIGTVANESMGGVDPVVEIQYSDKGGRILDEIFDLWNPGYRHDSTSNKIVASVVQTSSPPSLVSDAAPNPAPTVPLSSVDLDDSIFDVASSEFSDDVYPIFNFDLVNSLEFKEMDLYRPLFVPSRVSLPVRILSIVDPKEFLAVIQPTRHWLKDSPSHWQEQVDGFGRLQTELQRSAPLFPDIDVGESKSPCACRYSKDDRWYRGKLAGYVDDALSIVKVELVDIGITLEVRSCRVKQLPTEYLSLPRHSTTSRLIDTIVPPLYPPSLGHLRDSMKNNKQFTAFFKEVNQPLQMRLFYRDRDGKNIPAIE